MKTTTDCEVIETTYRHTAKEGLSSFQYHHLSTAKCTPWRSSGYITLIPKYFYQDQLFCQRTMHNKGLCLLIRCCVLRMPRQHMNAPLTYFRCYSDTRPAAADSLKTFETIGETIYPKPIKLGPRAAGWRAEEIHGFIRLVLEGATEPMQ